MADHRSGLKRRTFIKSSLAGLTGLFFSPAACAADDKTAPPTAAPPKLIQRPLGRTGIRLPIVSMGVMNADNPNLVRAALDRGIVLLDTAHVYQRGRNEEMIGQVVKGRPRDSFVVGTKVLGMPMDHITGRFTAETSGEAFLERFHLSLRRLGLEYVDILYLHNVSKRESVLFEPLLRALEKAKKDGQARFIGVSTHENEPEVIRAAVEGKIHDVVLTAYNFRQEHRLEVKKAISEAAGAGLGIVAMKTQAGSWLDRARSKPINMTAALKWVLQDENVSTAIPGFTAFDQLELDLTVMADLAFTEQEKADLKAQEQLAGLYCQHCGQCRDQCRLALPVPDLMRSYMYAYGYRNTAAARDLLVSLEVADSPCTECGACPVRCARGFDVKERITDILRLRDVPVEFLG